MPTIDADTRGELAGNIYSAAHAAIDWDAFPWHFGARGECQAAKRHSSQALALDVFGTIHQSAYRDPILGALSRSLSLPDEGPWRLDLEWCVPRDLLCESRPTQVDVRLLSPTTVIFVECKFTEAGGGCCSQPLPRPSGSKAGKRQCDGSYRSQTNPVNGVTNRCALSGKGIRYWDFISEVFPYSAQEEYSPCPFAGPWFQWMRNLTACRAFARRSSLQSGVILAYADAPGLSVAKHVRSPDWQMFTNQLLPGAPSFRLIKDHIF